MWEVLVLSNTTFMKNQKLGGVWGVSNFDGPKFHIYTFTDILG
jgi:hypothetical protein